MVMSPGAFNSAPGLQTIRLDSNQLTSLGSNMFSSLSSLQSLYLQNNSLSTIGLDTFYVGSQNYYQPTTNNLQIINLASNKLSILNTNAFNYLNNLQSLDLSNNKLKNLNIKMFSGMSNLLNVNLGGNPISFALDNSSSVIFNL